jgi:hypothetical protein|tara:strand:+ start:744 stop:998 length:255 start_codon:yes stop_codon:yes gene_type:complete
MKLPVIKKLASDRTISEDDINKAIKILEIISDARGVKEEELDVIGELISNLEGSKIVINEHRHYGVPLKEALNKFMQRVINSIK